MPQTAPSRRPVAVHQAMAQDQIVAARPWRRRARPRRQPVPRHSSSRRISTVPRRPPGRRTRTRVPSPQADLTGLRLRLLRIRWSICITRTRRPRTRHQEHRTMVDPSPYRRISSYWFTPRILVDSLRPVILRLISKRSV